MKELFLISFLFSLGIFVFLSFNFLKYAKDERRKKIISYLSFIGLLYLIIAILSFLWILEFLNYYESDFLIIYFLILFLQSLFLFKIVYSFSKNKFLFLPLGFYILLFVFVVFLGGTFINFFLILSFLLFLLFFLNLLLRGDEYKDVGVWGIFYSSLSLLLQILFFLGIVEFYIFFILSTGLFFYFIWNLTKHLKKNPPLESIVSIPKDKPYFFIFLNHFVFLLILTNFIFVGAVVVHEFGHLLASNLYDCEDRKIVYEEGLPHTEALCSGEVNNPFILFSGIGLPLILAFLLFLIGGKFLKEIGFLIVGFNLIVCFKDFKDLGLSDNLTMFFIVLGGLFILVGIVLLAKSKTEEHFYGLK